MEGRLDRVAIMGVVNITPDSFSDGGRYFDTGRAREHAWQLVEAGADWIDVGGESSRPGAQAISAEAELERVLPLIRALARELPVPISIDTAKARVAQAALEEGARMVNDIEAGLHDRDMLPTVARYAAQYCAMHMQGRPRDMQDDPRYHNVLGEVSAFLAERREAALAAGIGAQRLWLDPGIGFGKTLAHNLELLRGLPQLLELGAPLLVGVSRKSFLARIASATGGTPPAPEQRGALSLAAELYAARQGASLLRTHDVRSLREALAVEAALR